MKKVPSRTDPVRQLIDEHEMFMEALNALARSMNLVPHGSDELPEPVFKVVCSTWLAVNEHLNVHFVKEEEVFFPIIERIIPGARVKFQFLHIDHEKLRENFEEFTIAIQNYKALGVSGPAVAALKRVSTEMVRWFSFHIIAEDSIYFEIARSEMSPEEVRAALSGMQALEDQLREKGVDPRS